MGTVSERDATTILNQLDELRKKQRQNQGDTPASPAEAKAEYAQKGAPSGTRWASDKSRWAVEIKMGSQTFNFYTRKHSVAETAGNLAVELRDALGISRGAKAEKRDKVGKVAIAPAWCWHRRSGTPRRP